MKILMLCCVLVVVSHLSDVGVSKAVRNIVNVTTVAGQPVVLNCSLTGVMQVIWLRPPDSLPVRARPDDRSRGRFVVIGNSSVGRYDLLIQHAIFPDDVGQWTCSGLRTDDDDELHAQHVDLTVLVPPPTLIPEISPLSSGNMSSSSSNDNVYTVTCVSHFAFPPVELSWVKEYGPEARYSVSPPRMLVSRRGTVSSSLTLVLSSASAHSQFACTASHPTMTIDNDASTLGRRSFLFLPSTAGAGARSLPAQHPVQQSSSAVGRTTLDVVDQLFVLLAVLVVSCCLVVGVLLSNCQTHCRLRLVTSNTPLSWQQPTSKNGMAVHRQGNDSETSAMMQQQQRDVTATTTDSRGVSVTSLSRRDQCKLLVAASLTFMLITALLFSLPIYLKSVVTPTVFTDEMTAVFAGGALWLDCTTLAQPISSLIQVTWYRDDVLLYYQYVVNDRLISYPPNTTAGAMFHARVTSHAAGHVTMWPVAPGEQGVYTCDVLSVGSQRRSKTVTVFVLEGAVINYGLLVCLSVSLLSAIVILALTLQQTVVCQRHLAPASSSLCHQYTA